MNEEKIVRIVNCCLPNKLYIPKIIVCIFEMRYTNDRIIKLSFKLEIDDK